MSSAVGFLAIVVVVSVVGSLVVWLRSRKPTSFMTSIEDFQREMGALGGQPEAGRSARPTRTDRPDPIVPAPGKGDLARKLRDARRSTGELPADQSGER